MSRFQILTDEQWNLVADLLPGPTGEKGRPRPRVARRRGRPQIRPNEVRADKAYSSAEVRNFCRAHHISTIPEPDDRIRNRKGARGGWPAAIDKESHKGRNVAESPFCHVKQRRGIATRYDELAVIVRAGVMSVTMVAWLKYLSNTP